MPDDILTEADIRAEELEDWRIEEGELRAGFATGDFATGLRLVNLIGAAAEEADHHPDVLLTFPRIGVGLISHDVEGVTRRDVDMARRISGMAAQEGVEVEGS